MTRPFLFISFLATIHITLAFSLGATQTSAVSPVRSTASAADKPAAEDWRPISIDLTLDPTALDMAGCGAKGAILRLNGTHLTQVRPATIIKEPRYLGQHYYGAFRVGNGPKNLTWYAVDQVPDGPEQIYVDRNQNGDLTDDGPSDWDGSSLSGKGETVYHSTIALHASWGNTTQEKESGSYSFFLSKVRGESRLGYYRTTARVGKVSLNGKPYAIMLAEGTADAVFTVPAALDRTRGPLEFFIDLDGDGTFKGVKQMNGERQVFLPEQFAVSEPIQLANRWFFVRPNESGSNVKLIPAVPPSQAQVMAPVDDPFNSRTAIKNGAVAPDFIAISPEGKPVRLSDYRGKVVLLDFWATWCKPCQQSMPSLEKIYQDTKGQGVVVLSVNILDEKPLFDAWIVKHSKTDYNFDFAFDPAGKDDDNHKSIATKDYGVIGIPTMFVIDRNGKVFASLMGAGDTDKLKIALRGLEINVR